MSRTFPVTGPVSVMTEADVDTDIIFPARFLLLTEKTGLGRHAFADRRDQPAFPLPLDGSSPILVAGENFGCGSSREHAVWALHDFGIRAIIAPGFGEIFYNNCTRNGVLPVRLPQQAVDSIASMEGRIVTVDLAACEISGGPSGPIPFEIAAEQREALLNGWDETDRVKALFAEDIARYENRRVQSGLWL